jgi:hypothetical protein
VRVQDSKIGAHSPVTPLTLTHGQLNSTLTLTCTKIQHDLTSVEAAVLQTEHKENKTHNLMLIKVFAIPFTALYFVFVSADILLTVKIRYRSLTFLLCSRYSHKGISIQIISRQ